ncbi:small, acid-soluble spore protein, alpha/beta type [Paenibacillus gansuensis]|uniref:Small, acid-soluble spore protein, alpha/beta type n=1 Tax=Paenibacillus gansuensis TaxID=306542 RepID=A0ABW5PD45_9BACL
MARRSRRKPVVAGSRYALDQFKAEVMRREGFQVSDQQPNQVKFEVAKTMGIPLKEGYNGDLQTVSAGKIGGRIGGTMVREMIRMAQERLAQNHPRQ